MDSTEKYLELLADFPPVTREEWESRILEDLKGADFEKKLVWNSPEGFRIMPFYDQRDTATMGHLDSEPGSWPYTRGSQAGNNDWHIREDIVVKDVGRANAKALDILMKGVDSLGFVLDEKGEYTRDYIDALLKNIHAHSVELNFASGISSARIVAIILQLVKDYNRDLEKITGSVDFDPIGRLVSRGNFYGNMELSFQSCRGLIELADHLPNFRVIAINGKQFREAGAGIAQELAFSLAVGNDYLSKITEKGLSVTKVAPRLKFNFGIGSDYFLEIAKFRAARMLWAYIVKSYGGDDHSCRMHIHATNIDWNKTVYDPYVNMLRTTTEAMSAILGGADSLTVQPYNAIFSDGDAFAERIARNQQLLLKEESYLDKVIDPSAGSWYIETLTGHIAGKAWEIFRSTEKEGGFIKSFMAGKVRESITGEIASKTSDIANRRRVFLGTNQYPDITEAKTGHLDPGIMKPLSSKDKDAVTEPLEFYRGAQIFEALRFRTDRFVMEGGKRPVVFLLTIGQVAMRRARAMFSSNFFGCAGFTIIDNNGFDDAEQGIEEARAKQADIVVVCSSDEEYALTAPAVLHALKKEALVVVAGYPKDILEQLRSEGLEYFIHIRSNVHETLVMFQDKLNIPE